MTEGQVADAEDKAKSFVEAARKAVRAAWSHVLYPVRSETAGKPFALEHAPISARDRGPVPAAVYEKAKGDGSIAAERLGGENLWLRLKEIWPEDRPHLPISEVAEWFAKYVHMPRLRDRLVLDAAIHEAVARLDPRFGYADGVGPDGVTYRGLRWAKPPPDPSSDGAVLVRSAEALAQAASNATSPKTVPTSDGGAPGGIAGVSNGTGGTTARSGTTAGRKPTRFYGSVEIDATRPIKALEAIIDAVVMELRRAPGAQVRLVLDLEAEAPDGFDDADVGVVRDNARQLKFRDDSTGFGN